MQNIKEKLKAASLPVAVIAGILYTIPSVIMRDMRPWKWNEKIEERMVEGKRLSIIRKEEQKRLEIEMNNYIRAADNLYELACRHDGITNGYSHADMCWLAEQLGYEQKIEGQDIFRVYASRYIREKDSRFKATIEGVYGSDQILDPKKCFDLAATLDNNRIPEFSTKH